MLQATTCWCVRVLRPRYRASIKRPALDVVTETVIQSQISPNLPGVLRKYPISGVSRMHKRRADPDGEPRWTQTEGLVYTGTGGEALIPAESELCEERVKWIVADDSAELEGVRPMGPSHIVGVLETVVQACLWAAKVGTHVRVGKRLAGLNTLRRCLCQCPMPEEPRLIYGVRRRRRDHANIQRVVVGHLGDKAARISSTAGLHNQVVRQVALQVVTDCQGVFVRQPCVHFCRAHDLVRWRGHGNGVTEGSGRGGNTLGDFFKAAEPEKTILYKRSTGGETILVLEERGASAAVYRG